MKIVKVNGQRFKLPTGLRARKRSNGAVYYYLTPQGTGKEISVGANYEKAFEIWKQDRPIVISTSGKSMSTNSMHSLKSSCNENPQTAFCWIAAQYLLHEITHLPSKAQTTPLKLLKSLMSHFKTRSLDEIKKSDLKDWFKARMKVSRLRCRMEKAQLTHIWNWALKQNLTKQTMPEIPIFLLDESKSYRSDEIFARILKADPEFAKRVAPNLTCPSKDMNSLEKEFEAARRTAYQQLLRENRKDMSEFLAKFTWDQFCYSLTTTSTLPNSKSLFDKTSSYVNLIKQ